MNIVKNLLLLVCALLISTGTGKVYGCTSQCTKRVFGCNTNRWALSGYVMENGKMSIIQYSNAKNSITCRVCAILLNLPEISKGPLDDKNALDYY